MRQIIISDQTLKILARESGAPLLFREKTAIAAELERLGADRIELSPVTSFQEDRIIGATISAAIRNAAVAITTGVTEEEIAQAWQCVSAAARPCLIVELPVSTLKMEYTYHMKDRKMLEKAVALIAQAKALCPKVEFSAVDAIKADPAFLVEICAAAQQAGATSIALGDEDGDVLPEEWEKITSLVKQAVGVPVLVRCSDAFSLACANAAAALTAGADGVVCACAGQSTPPTGRFGALLTAKGEELGVTTQLDANRLRTDINAMLSHISAAPPTPDAAESGESVYLDADSTLPDLSLAAQKLGYELTEEDLGKVLKAVKQVCERKSTVGRRELEALIATYAMQAPSAYHLDSYLANCGNKTASLAHVALVRDGQTLTGVSEGDGPIDASFRAIEQSVGFHYELDDFQIQAVTEGKEALGAALVKLRSNGRLYSGNGISTDVVGASIRAYINALNKIIYEENG